MPPDESMAPPKFTQGLKDLAINDGESLVLTCYVQGDPEPQITWSKNSKVLSVVVNLSDLYIYDLFKICLQRD